MRIEVSGRRFLKERAFCHGNLQGQNGKTPIPHGYRAHSCLSSPAGETTPPCAVLLPARQAERTSPLLGGPRSRKGGR